MVPPEPSSLAAELSARLTAMERDLGEIKTACAVLVARSTRTEQDVRDLRSDTEQGLRDLRADMEAEFTKLRDDEVKPLEAELAATKARQWPLQSVAALTATAALGVTLWQAVGK